MEKLLRLRCTPIHFLNGHGGNNSVLQHIGIDLNGRGAVSAIVNWWQIAGQLNPDWKGGHGGAEETAAMLAIDPDCVHMEDYIPLQPQNLSDTLRCAGMSEVELDGVAVMTPQLFRNLSPGGWYNRMIRNVLPLSGGSRCWMPVESLFCVFGRVSKK